jgi:solute carrier family 35, member F1/2
MSSTESTGRVPHSPSLDKKDLEATDAASITVPALENDEAAKRPPIDYSSVGAFTRSIGRRFASIWTKRFVLSLLAGQIVSLCITCTNVTTTELVMRNWALPTTQTFFL